MSKPACTTEGFHAFMLHLDQISRDSIDSPDLPEEEREELNEGRMRLRCVTPGLQRIAAKCEKPDELYRLAWELAAGAFLIGSRGVVSGGARTHTRANNARHAARTRLEKRKAGSGKDALIDGVIARHMQGPVKAVLQLVNNELSAKGIAPIAASTLSRRRRNSKP